MAGSLINYVFPDQAVGRMSSIYPSHFSSVPIFSSISREILFLYRGAFLGSYQLLRACLPAERVRANVNFSVGISFERNERPAA